MANWKKIGAVGVVIGAGVYAFTKFLAPKLSVMCIHDIKDENEGKTKEKDVNTECDYDNCDLNGACGVHIQAVPLSELPDEVKDAIGALAGAVGFDVKSANEPVPQPHGEYVPNKYDLD